MRLKITYNPGSHAIFSQTKNNIFKSSCFKNSNEIKVKKKFKLKTKNCLNKKNWIFIDTLSDRSWKFSTPTDRKIFSSKQSIRN